MTDKTSINELIGNVLYDFSGIENNASFGDPTACFQMGIVQMLGLVTPMDFNAAASFFSKDCLKSDPNANRMLGFICEIVGDFNSGFAYYANVNTHDLSQNKGSYIQKVYNERCELQKYFKKLGLPINAFNEELSKILNDFRNKDSKLNASLKLAEIVNNNETCSEVAQLLADYGYCSYAMLLLKRGGILDNSTLAAKIDSKMSKSMDTFQLSNSSNVIEIDGCSLLIDDIYLDGVDEAKLNCKNKTTISGQNWRQFVSMVHNTILPQEKKRIEKIRRREQAAYKRQQEKIRKQRMAIIKAVIWIGVCLAVFYAGYKLFDGVKGGAITLGAAGLAIAWIKKAINS